MGCLGGCFKSCLAWTVGLICGVLGILCWLLGWISWAIFKVAYLVLLCIHLAVFICCAAPPSSAIADADKASGENHMQALVMAAQSGDIGSQYALAVKYQEIAEADSFGTSVTCALSGLPEQLGADEQAIKAGEQAEYWYGKVAEQGYMRARINLWEMVLARWERTVEFWCWAGEVGSKGASEAFNE